MILFSEREKEGTRLLSNLPRDPRGAGTSSRFMILLNLVLPVRLAGVSLFCARALLHF